MALAPGGQHHEMVVLQVEVLGNMRRRWVDEQRSFFGVTDITTSRQPDFFLKTSKMVASSVPKQY